MRSISEILESDHKSLTDEEFKALIEYKEERAEKRAYQRMTLEAKSAESSNRVENALANHEKLLASIPDYIPPVLEVVSYG